MNSNTTSMPMPSWDCIGLDGQRVPHGAIYVSGPDYCTTCKCDEGEPKFCRAALCQPLQNCKSFRIGNSCCEFICLDDIIPTLPDEGGGRGNDQSDFGLRLVASTITAIMSLALLLFLIHRLRQRRLRAAQHQYFQETVDGMHAEQNGRRPCCQNSVYHTSNEQIDLFLDDEAAFSPNWKPLYGVPYEAPPPYSEVIATDPSIIRSIDVGPVIPFQVLSVNPNNQDRQLPYDPPPPFEERLAIGGGSTVVPLEAAGVHIMSDEVYASTSTRPRMEARYGRSPLCHVLPQPSPVPPIEPMNNLDKGPDEVDETCAHCTSNKKCNVCSV